MFCSQYISRVQNGRSLNTGQSFEDFLGPLHKTLKDKYWEWLTTVYCKCYYSTSTLDIPNSPPARSELVQGPAVEDSHVLPSLSPGSSLPEPVSAPPDSLPPPSPSQVQPPAIAPVHVSSATVDVAPAPTIPTPPETLADAALTSPVASPLLVPPSPSSPLSTTTPPLTSDGSMTAPPLISGGTASERLPSRPPSTPTPTGETHSQHNKTIEWPPKHTPTWNLGPQHPKYVQAAANFLIGVPGGPEWETLLELWAVFESLSSSNITVRTWGIWSRR